MQAMPPPPSQQQEPSLPPPLPPPLPTATPVQPATPAPSIAPAAPTAPTACAPPTRTSSILSSVAADASLLRWLHSHDPDRNITPEILSVSATYNSSVVASDLSAPALPPVASLFVPMYNRSHFVLGQLYGPMSPNALALNMLAHAGYGKPPHPISRRFVVDLSFRDSLQFIEYEWFSDGKLCISTHNVGIAGEYTGKSMLMAPPTPIDQNSPLQKHDLLEGVSKRQHASREIMTLWFTQKMPACTACADSDNSCNCAFPETPASAHHNSFVPPENWITWLAAFGKSRMGMANMTLRFSMATAMGPMTGSNEVRLQQNCELGVSHSQPQGSLLLRMFMDQADMLVSHPTTDSLILAAEEKRDRIDLANDLSEEDENWAVPRVFSLNESNGTPYPIMERGSDETFQSPYESADNMSASLCEGSGGSQNAFLASQDVSAQRAFSKTKIDTDAIGFENLAVESSSGEQRNDATSDIALGILRNGRVSKRKGKQGDRLFVCDCGKIFTHKGHFNEHRLCVHEKVRQHRCLFLNCQR